MTERKQNFRKQKIIKCADYLWLYVLSSGRFCFAASNLSGRVCSQGVFMFYYSFCAPCLSITTCLGFRTESWSSLTLLLFQSQQITTSYWFHPELIIASVRLSQPLAFSCLFGFYFRFLLIFPHLKKKSSTNHSIVLDNPRVIFLKLEFGLIDTLL